MFKFMKSLLGSRLMTAEKIKQLKVEAGAAGYDLGASDTRFGYTGQRDERWITVGKVGDWHIQKRR